jgi:hypothetical protein
MDIKPYVKSKRIGLGASIVALLAVAQQFGMVVHPLVAVGAYLLGNIVSKVIDEKKKK